MKQHKEQFAVEQIQAHEITKGMIFEIDKLNTRIRKTDNEVLVANYESQLSDLLVKKEKLEEIPEADPYTQEEFGTASKRVLDTLKDPVSMWQSPNYEDKRTIAYMYFNEKIPYDYEKGFGTSNLAYPVQLIQSFSGQEIPDVEMRGVSPCVVKELLNVYKRS